jgi:type III restriction enzyme
MPAFNLLKFQKKAIDELNEAFLKLWKKTDRQLPIVFKSPTGSGKTLTVAHFIRGLNHLPQWNEDKVFIWITFSDDLAMQSRDKFKEYFENNLENNLSTVNDINRGKLYENDILFLNWQKVVSRSAETRVLRRPAEDEIQKESGSYFEDVIDGTKKDKREIILIVDESHTHRETELAQDIINYIDPKIIIHITATPSDKDVAKAATIESFVQVDRQEVVDEGLIKEKISVQTEEDLKKFKGKDLDKVLLQLGIEKRDDIKKELKLLGKDVNPLMLIQLPNDDKELITTGDKTKEEVVCQYLTEQGVKKTQIAKWFDNKKENLDYISDNDNDIDFMLFKQAAGTGWDCPRASVLVMFREIKSDKFYTQTVGRILRMAEPQLKEDYKDNPNLRIGYLFTNYQRNQVQVPDQVNGNKPYTLHAYRKEDIKNIELESAFISRIDYGDIPASFKFQASFVMSMDKYFGITKDDILGKTEKKLKKAGVDLSEKLTNSVIANANFEDFDQLAFDFKKRGIDVNLEMSTNDVEKTFNYLCYQLLKEQTDEKAKYTNIARSWGVLKSAIRIWFKSVLGDDSNYYYRVFVKDIQKGASSKFKPAITKALSDFKPAAQEILKEKKKRQEEKETPIFEIEERYDFTDDYEEVPQKLCALNKLFVLKDYKGKKNELDFVKYIDGKNKHIDWWFKNGNKGKEYFAIKYFDNTDSKEALFYPDWVIRFKNGEIGIFDTKKGQTATEQETKDKAKYLALKIKKLDKKFIGGIVVFENGVWYYNNSEKYSYKKGKINEEKNWKLFEDLFK